MYLLACYDVQYIVIRLPMITSNFWNANIKHTFQ